MAGIDWDEIFDKADDFGKELIDVIKPFGPALAREGPDIYEGFIKHLFNKDFTKIDELMYSRMTAEERKKLDLQVTEGVLDAARAKFRRRKLAKDVMFKVLLRAIILASVG